MLEVWACARKKKNDPYCTLLDWIKHWLRLSYCRTCHWLTSGRNRAWKLGLKPQTVICGCYLPQADPWSSRVLPCGMASVSCHTNKGPQSWTEHLGEHRWLCSPSQYFSWTVSAWWSPELVSIILAGTFGMLNPLPPSWTHFLSWKKTLLPIQSSRRGSLDLKIICLLANKAFLLAFSLQDHFYMLLAVIR